MHIYYFIIQTVDYESSAKCVKLDVNAEIIVSPKQRTNVEDEQAKELENEGEKVNSSSIILRSYPQQYVKQYNSMNKDKNGMILPSKKNLNNDTSSLFNNQAPDTLGNNDNILGTIPPVELNESIDVNTISLFANENQIQEIFPDFTDGDTMHFEILDKTYLNENQNIPENENGGDSLENNKNNSTTPPNLPSSNSDSNNSDIQTLPHYKEINLMLFTNKDVPRDHILISPELQCLLSIQPFDLIK